MTAAAGQDIPIYTAGVNAADDRERRSRRRRPARPHAVQPPSTSRTSRGPRSSAARRRPTRPGRSSFIATFALACSVPDDEQVGAARGRGDDRLLRHRQVLRRSSRLPGSAPRRGDPGRPSGAATWRRWSAAVTETMVDEFAAAGRPDEVDAKLRRYDGAVDEVVLFPPSFDVGPERRAGEPFAPDRARRVEVVTDGELLAARKELLTRLLRRGG